MILRTMPSSDALIKKRVLHAGSAPAEFKQGSRVVFHFVTKLCDPDETVIDDSRAVGRPMELVIGKKFKLEIWETILQLMSLNEVASFTVDKSLVGSYPFVSKTLRDIGKPPDEKRGHCCGVTIQNEGLGYDDLNKLMKEPADLEFIIEILKVEAPEDYKKESWQMSDEEKYDEIPKLREQGNTLYKDGKYEEASAIYTQGLGFIEQLMLKEKPRDTEWLNLQSLKVPLLLNLSACKLKLNECYTVVEHCSTILQIEPDNVKALYRRAKGHVGAWNPAEARADFRRVMELDPPLTAHVKNELKELDELVRQKDVEDMAKLAGKMFVSSNPS